MTHDELAWHVSLAGRALSSRIRNRLSEHGLGRGEYRVLFALCDEEGLTQTDLVARHRLDKSVVARVTGRLEEKGYVERRPDPDDRRRKRLFLTPAAEELRDDVRTVQDAIEAEMTQGLDDAEVDALVDGLRTVARNLGADPTPEGDR